MTLPHSKPIPPAPIYPDLLPHEIPALMRAGIDQKLKDLKIAFGYFSYSMYENDATGEIVVMRNWRPTRSFTSVAGLEGYARELGILR